MDAVSNIERYFTLSEFGCRYNDCQQLIKFDEKEASLYASAAQVTRGLGTTERNKAVTACTELLCHCCNLVTHCPLVP
jgi:hypothetical protein